MKTMLILLAGVAALSPALNAKIERTVEKTFTVQPGGTLRVETEGGSIRVEPAAGDRVEVAAREIIRADSEAEADKLLAKLELTIEQTGDKVNARAHYPRMAGWLASGSGAPVQVSFEVKVPAKFNAELYTSGGNLNVGDLTGKITGRTSGGDVRVGRIDGEVKLSTSGGNIALASATDDVELTTSGGDIRVKRTGDEAKLRTSGGNIVIEEAADEVHASTSGGDVTVGFAGTLKDDSELRTSGGGVRVKVPAGAAFDLDASTSGGAVRADGLTVKTEKGGSGRSRLKGKVNGGGPTLKLRSSGGDVRIEAIGS